jgi:hypothetical protein
MACAARLNLDEDKLNVNGGAIAIGHPLGATGVRLSVTVARELKRAGPALRHRLGLHRRRAGHRTADRESRRNRQELKVGRQWTSRDTRNRHRRRLRPRGRDRRAAG